MDPVTLVLVHSPIVGPDTWAPVADVLRAQGHQVLVPELARGGPIHWQAHAGAVVAAVRRSTLAGPVVVVAHSGAGPLVGHIGSGLRAAGTAPAGYAFVDAGLPAGGASRLDQLADEHPEMARDLGDLLRSGGRFPIWDADDLAPLVPDPARRRRLVAGLRPAAVGYWTEPIPAAPGWPDAPCGVLLLSDGYPATARRARDDGWPLLDLAAGNHFLMLAEPDTVAARLLQLTGLLLSP